MSPVEPNRCLCEPFHVLARLAFPGLMIASLIVACLAGCKKEPATPVPASQPTRIITIGYCAPEMFGGQIAIMNGLSHHAHAKGWKVLIANANDDATTQQEQIRHFISKHVDAIVAVPIDSRGIKTAIEQADQAGIPFYTIDRAALDCPVRMTVLSDNFGAGVRVATYVVEALRKSRGEARGSVIELAGDVRQNVAQLRKEGFHSVIDGYPGISVQTFETQWVAAKHAEIIESVLIKSVPDVIFMHSDGAGISSILPVLRRAGHLHKAGAAGHIALVGIDGSPGMLQAIRTGYADQSASQPFPDFGIIVNWIDMDLRHQAYKATTINQPGAPWSPATLSHGPEGWRLLLSTTIVTSENVDNKALWGNHDMAADTASTMPQAPVFP